MNSDQVALEAKVMFLERTLEEMSQAMVEQGRLTEAFERRLARLERKFEAKRQPEIGPHDEAPPHY